MMRNACILHAKLLIVHTLQIRNVPEDVFQTLKALAEKEERSISKQALVLIRRALEGNHDLQKRRLSATQSLKKLKRPKSNFKALKELRKDRESR